MKKILVPVDFSDFSINALEVATYIARVKEMEILLLHVMEDSYTPYYNMVGMGMIEDETLVNYRKELEVTLREQLAKLSDKVGKQGVEVDYEIIGGRPYPIIIQEALDNDVDLIVMGSHGQNDIEEIFIGGNSEKVIRKSSIPVLTVHKVRPDFQIDRIVFASDFEEPEVEPVLEEIIRFAEVFMAELFLVRVNTGSGIFQGETSRQRVDDLAKKFNLSAGAVTSFNDRNEEEGIVNYANEINADLITLCTHGRTGLARLFKGSIAEEVAGFSEIPVLTYNISIDKTERHLKAVSRDKQLKIEHDRAGRTRATNEDE